MSFKHSIEYLNDILPTLLFFCRENTYFSFCKLIFGKYCSILVEELFSYLIMFYYVSLLH